MQDTFASLAPAIEEGQRILNGMRDILSLYVTRIAAMALVILSARVVGEFPLELRQGALITLFSVGIPATMIAVWAKPGAAAKNAVVTRVFHFVLTPTLVTSVIALVLFYGTLVLLLYQNPEYNSNIPPQRIGAIYDSVRFIAQSTLASFLVLCGLLTVIFIEPPTPWWAAVHPARGEWRPTILVCFQLLAFVFILIVPPLSDLFSLARLGLQEIGLFVGATIIWLICVQFLWRQKIFERFLGNT